MTVMTLIVALFGYILGSIPFGLVLSKAFGYGDIRKSGSKSIGATNVLRITGSKKLALATIVLDASKAAISYLIAFYIFRDITLALLAGSMAVIGHCHSFWLGFKGGKGVASALGLILVASPMVALLALITWIVVAVTTRYSSLSAIMAALLVPLYTYFFATPVHLYFYIPLVIYVIIRHHTNIKRLIKGEETKIKLKKKADDK